MKTTRVVGVGVAFVLAITFILRGQVTVTFIQAETISLSGTDVAMFKSLSDAQLETLVNALEAMPTVSTDSLPRGGRTGTFFSLQHPEWPPLPCDMRGTPVWKLGGGSFLLNDLAVNYTEPQLKSSVVESGMSAMDSPSPLEFDGSDGFTENFQPHVFNTNDLWLQVRMTNTTVSLAIHSPWNVTNGVYDLFATTNLAPSAWQWVLRCAPGQTNLTVTGLTYPQDFFILGLTNDADGDGLTDAYEKLVSHTDPNNPYSNLDGLPDGWEAMLGLDPQVSNPAQPGTRANYLYYSSDWLNRVSGVKNETVGLDNEGNVTQVSQ